MKLWIVAMLGAGLTMAQNPNSGASYYGKTWVGLLVSGSCQSGGKHTRATAEADRTVTDRVTTPAVDSTGTRGSSEPEKPMPAARGDVPQTGDLSVRDNGKIRDKGWKQAQHQAASLAAGCRVNPDTSAFALLQPDGSLLRFDDVANTKIVDQLRSRGTAESGKVLRVQVTGKLQGGALAIDEIQM